MVLSAEACGNIIFTRQDGEFRKEEKPMKTEGHARHLTCIPSRRLWTLAAGALTVLAISGQSTRAQDAAPAVDTEGAHANNSVGACDQTTQAAAKACDFNTQNDFWIAVGTCDNVSNSGKKAECNKAAQADLKSAKSDCEAQNAARQQVCQAIGQAPYDPKIDPQNFVKYINNPFLPLKPGTVYVYDLKIPNSPKGTDTFFVTRQTIDILGVRCVVVHDTVAIGGKVEEDTFDYFAQDKQHNVWYFGEDTAQLEDGVVVGVEGAWRAGVNGAQPGIVMEANPKRGDEYRQEFALGEAEDMAKVVALDQKLHVPGLGSYSNALKTFEFSALEPDARENKFYVPGVGNVLTVDLETGERDTLVKIDHR
jgi:hypothetical protein